MRAFTISAIDLARCPIKSLSTNHYNGDGTCNCFIGSKQVDIPSIAERLEMVRRDIAIDAGELNERKRGAMASTLYEVIEELVPDFYEIKITSFEEAT